LIHVLPKTDEVIQRMRILLSVGPNILLSPAVHLLSTTDPAPETSSLRNKSGRLSPAQIYCISPKCNTRQNPVALIRPLADPTAAEGTKAPNSTTSCGFFRTENWEEGDRLFTFQNYNTATTWREKYITFRQAAEVTVRCNVNWLYGVTKYFYSWMFLINSLEDVKPFWIPATFMINRVATITTEGLWYFYGYMVTDNIW
jgi:hypothetical protein